MKDEIREATKKIMKEIAEAELEKLSRITYNVDTMWDSSPTKWDSSSADILGDFKAAYEQLIRPKEKAKKALEEFKVAFTIPMHLFGEETREARQRTCGNCKHYRFLSTSCQHGGGGPRDQDDPCNNGKFRDAREGE